MVKQLQIDFDVRDPNAISADVSRLTGQNKAIYLRLLEGPATNAELSEISLKYTSRISDIRNAGVAIDCVRLGGGLTRYEISKGRNEQHN